MNNAIIEHMIVRSRGLKRRIVIAMRLGITTNRGAPRMRRGLIGQAIPG